MPINESVIDAMAHLLDHWFDDQPEAELTAEAMADYIRTHVACQDCVRRFLEAVGSPDLADAVARVWDSEVWQAFVARHDEAEDA